MRLRYIVDIDVEPVSDSIANVLRSEIQSNLESIDAYYAGFRVLSVGVVEDTSEPLRDAQTDDFDYTDYDDDGTLLESAICPSCQGESAVLGVLGNLLWRRCRDCGIDFSVNTERSK